MSFLGTFSEYVDYAVSEVNVVDPDLTEFIRTDACVEEQEQHRPVAVGMLEFVGKFSIFTAVGLGPV